MDFKVINVRRRPEYKDLAVDYFERHWGNRAIYEDCISHSFAVENPLPVWYLLMAGDEIIGCAGLITNDFISRMDLLPWLCALYVDEGYRGQNLSAMLIEQVKMDCAAMGFKRFYLATDHVGFYEKHGFVYLADGYHPWGESSRIYEREL